MHSVPSRKPRHARLAPGRPAGIACCLAVALLFGLWPYAASAYHLDRGARLLSRAVQAKEASQPELASRALAELQTGLHWHRNNAQAYRLAARAHLLLGELPAAEQALNQAVALLPANPLVSWERISLLKRIEQQESNSAATRNQATDRLVRAWQSAGYGQQEALRLLDQAWAAQLYRDVLTWYRVSDRLPGPLPRPVQFRAAVAAVAAGQPLPHLPNQEAILIHLLDGPTRIEGEDLQWLSQDLFYGLDYGQGLIDHPSLDPTVGVLWWAGAAVAVLDVPCEGDYEVQIRAKHSTDLPGEIELEHNLAAVARFSIGPDWQVLASTVHLAPGLHLLGIRYLEDSGDAVLDWLQVSVEASG